ncbi:hypothetical protein BV898_16047 [Hypsibius exemplaris]|uniref:Uncharacterized protein n=1 Tax=Hypsibius exemplaris TaxID=2072580 RepID=A0A9X6NCE9_HYPEX|nr:hypothetical protein BV898_16047 [Hypsibius exemplaris]
MVCGQTVYLSCSSLASLRTSSLLFDNNVAEGFCVVHFRLLNPIGCPGISFGIYMNIKLLNLRQGDSGVIREVTDGYNNLAKILPGGPQTGSSVPQSVAQVMSHYTYSPGFDLELTLAPGQSYRSSPIFLDVNILNEHSHSASNIGTYCNALRGFEHDDLCDSDEVSCPTSYVNTTGLNPATGIQHSCGLAIGEIAGISVGVVSTIIFFVVVFIIVRRRNRLRVIHHHAAHTTAHQSGPVIIPGGAVNPGYGQPQYYQGPTPQYGAVTSGPAASYPSPYAAGS